MAFIEPAWNAPFAPRREHDSNLLHIYKRILA